MSKAATLDASRPDYDEVIQQITDYVLGYDVRQSREAMETARYDWMDSIGCALLALNYPACTKLLGPMVPGAQVPGGSRVPGTPYELDPVRAAWNIGAMVRWLDYNDTWLAAEWGHPSDNLGAILALADFRARQNGSRGSVPVTLGDVLRAMIKAHEIQGVLALENSFNRVGLDHVLLVRIASAAVSAAMLGCSRDEVLSAVSHAWLDGSALRTYRHAPNTGPRKSWAAGDASSRGLFLALIAASGEIGYPSALTAKGWGFQDVSFDGKPIQLGQPFGTYVMENVLFKISYPAEFHAQTAVEAAITLHPQVKDRLGDIERILIETTESGDRIINKTGPLNNPADRDHCLQYMVAVPLIQGSLSADDYEDSAAANPLIDQLRAKMEVVENERFSREYLEADKRAIGNAVQVFFSDGSSTEKVSVDYPVGHRRRRGEGIPLLKAKFERYLRGRISQKSSDEILSICADQAAFEACSVERMMTLLSL
ncbi:bifunctional 2-methylcitrate dehydratase/aconitate hydratase [Lamprobacter modestohalophilus]|uniref:bifunctional 2-methylcitrate dehydratase/aconitate hydratase n=1 Tax=Lamprobacter modestohalophilus TaxID=1064514 RepID=UPI002ADEC1DE|nr:bifunctional 2-methylcitrate dehydratase/aconitate hydratase [Lamprobacter modestohalophilus]MEA1048649.1 bifunctional 2-methylcitrate dehydratase/aconitate hydratase [Lamprobacter modestohalophilus]